MSESAPTPPESPTEPTEPAPPELYEVLFVVCQKSGQPKVYKGKAYVFPENIYIDTIDAKGLAWLRAWQDSGFFTAYELEIKTKFSREHLRRTLFEGFVSIGYLNPRDAPDRAQNSIERFVAFLRVNLPFRGTPLVRNWREFKEQNQAWYCEEWIIYSDACFSGSFELGPYKVLNTVAREEIVNGSLVLRAYIHPSFMDYKPYVPQALRKDHRNYRDYRERLVVSFCGEIAALLSVVTDRRLIAGGSIRRLGGATEDTMGDPLYPGAPPAIHRSRQPILPYYSHHEPAHLSQGEDLLSKYLELKPTDAATFLRAARLYHKALLECDEEPDLAWVWSVSAIEALAEVPGSTDKPSVKFYDFLARHLPDPPPVRPPHFQVDWGNLRPVFGQIYEYRSQFLHAGFPFPVPMTRRPEDVSRGDKRYAERPPGGLGYGDTTFDFDASPMHFHVFLYIVRGAMLKWLHHTYEGTRGVQSPPPGSGEGDVNS